MATRVEVGAITPLTGVPGLSELAKEETLKRTYFCQAGDTSGVPSTRILEGKSPRRNPARLFPLPRLTPKPFSREKAPDPALPAAPLRSGPSLPATLPKDAVAVEVDVRMPASWGQQAGGGVDTMRGLSPFNKAALLWPGPDSLILSETTPAGPILGKGVQQGAPEMGPRASQEPPSGPQPEVAAKPTPPGHTPVGTLPWAASLSQEARPPATEEQRGQTGSLPEASRVDSPAGPAPEARPRLKRRPVSAIFTDPLGLQRPAPAMAGKAPPAPPEKTWVRKPRPLSMDLTARFESQEALLSRAAEEGPGAAAAVPADRHRDTARPQPEPTVDGARWDKAEAPLRGPETDFPERARRTQERKEKGLFEQGEPGSPGAPGGPAKLAPKGDPSPWEERARPDGEPEPPSPRPRKGQESAGARDSAAAAGESPAPREWASRGSVKRRISLFGEASAPAVAGGSKAPPAAPEVAPEPEKGGLSVQDRIRGWAGETPEAKPEIPRRVFQARPLSADLTKLFSGPASSNEVKSEKCSEMNKDLPRKPREKQKEEHSLDGASVPRRPWTRQEVRQTEQKDASIQDPENGRGENSVGAPGPYAVTPEDDGSFRTVWATVFEHHVERHSVVGQSGRCPSATTPGEMARTHDSESRPRSERGSWPGKVLPGKAHPKKENSRWMESPEAENLGPTAFPNGEPKWYHMPLPEKYPLGEKQSNPFLKPSENPPTFQRIEAKYDILHAVGERAHSEAVSTAPEGKAVTLRSSRSRLSWREGQLSHEVTPADPERSLEGPVGPIQRASLIWEGLGAHEAGGPKSDCREPKDTPGGNCPSPRWMGGALASWNKATVVVREQKGLEVSPVAASERSARPCAPGATPGRAVKAAVQEEQHAGAVSQPGGSVLTGERGPPQGCPLDPPSRAKDEPSASQAGTHPHVFSMPKGPLGEGEPKPVQALASDVTMRKGSWDQRTERWRRRTLPHDVKFDEFSFLAPEDSSKVEQRRMDYLILTADNFKKTPQPTHSRAKMHQVSPDVAQDRTFVAVKQGSPVEPKATFFAVTYQIPDTQKAKSVVKPGPADLVEHSRKMTPPPSPHPLASTLVSLNHEKPLETLGSKNGAQGRERENLSISKTLKPNHRASSLRVRPLDPSSERIIDVDALWTDQPPEDVTGFQKDWKESGIKLSPRNAPQTTPTFKSHTKAGDFVVRRRTEMVSETFPGKIKDGYRSSILDIDVLMAEYTDQWAKGPGEGKAEHSSSLPERPGQPGGVERGRRSLKETPQARGLQKQASFTDMSHSSSPSPDQPPAECPGAVMDTRVTPPLWALPYSAPPEKYPGTPSGPVGSRKSFSGITEDDKRVFRQHGSKCQNRPAESKTPGREALSSEASVAPRSPPTDLRKGAPRRSPGREDEDSGAQWGNHPHGPERATQDVKRAYSEKGPPAQVREGLSIMQKAREWRQEQPNWRRSFPGRSLETKETNMGSYWQDSGTQGGHKVQLQDLGQEGARQSREQPPLGPRRSHSFGKDKRSGHLVIPFFDKEALDLQTRIRAKREKMQSDCLLEHEMPAEY
ncbi:uncharacterized protein KIAA1671 homolog isoform X2 [Tamandua tetradactyla]|uniref:uncharacterized protein KIAA1671 homolog isoform X2 n=1 Tax=Tamandua tetradactyla TaxID=48850 RepID=UPI004053A8A0